MKPYSSLKSVLAEFFPLHRTLASDDHDKTLEIVGSYMPDSSNYTIETYAPLTPVWTWKVPERYVVHEAYLETADGERIVDFKDKCRSKNERFVLQQIHERFEEGRHCIE